MGQTSSQLEQPPASQVQVHVQVPQSSSPAPSVGTTASKTLARDLERSVAESAKKQTSRPLKRRKTQTGRVDVASPDETATKPRQKSRAAELRDEARRVSTQSQQSPMQKEDQGHLKGSEVVERPRTKRKAAKEMPIKAEPVETPVEVEQPPKKKKKGKAHADKQFEDHVASILVQEPQPVVQARVTSARKPKATGKQKHQPNAREQGSQTMVKDMVRVAEKPPKGVSGQGVSQLDSDEDLDALIKERELTADEINFETENQGPYHNDSEQFDAHRAHARNQLRAHLKSWDEEDLVYQGRAKWKKRSNGEMYLKYAAPGKHFKDNRTEEDKRIEALRAEARSDKVAACKRTLLAVIVRDELRKNPGAKPVRAKRREEVDIDERAGGASVHIPTPPESAVYNPINPAGHHAEDQVTDWLASQNEESPVPPDQLPPQAKMSRKRKRVSTHRADDDDDFEAETVVPEDSNSVSTATREAAKAAKAAERRRQKKKRQGKQQPVEELPDASEYASSGDGEPQESDQQEPKKPKSIVRSHATATGPFLTEEKETADRIFGEALRAQKLSEAELAAKIKDWRTCVWFKESMYTAFPNRTQASVRKFAQRRFHGMERGAWTEEQDNALMAANKLYPEQWTKISDHVGRTGPDCKDRWRLQLQYRNRALGPWSVEEEDRLMAAVEKCIEAIKSDNAKDKKLMRDRDRLDALISWTAVAAKLGRTRSTKRCREKYEKLKARKAKDVNGAMGHGAGSTTRTNQHAKKAKSEENENQRMPVARRIVKQSFELGDYYDALMEIHTAFKDRDQQYHDEGNVIWSIVSTKNMNSRFSMTSYASSLRRVVYESAIKDWVVNAPKMTKRVEKAKTIPARAFILATWLEKQYVGRLQDLKRTYMPELVGKSPAEISEIKKERKEGKAERRAKRATGVKKSGLSKDLVTDSEDEDDAAHSDASTSDDEEPEVIRTKRHDTDDEDMNEISKTREEAIDHGGNEAETCADDDDGNHGSDDETGDEERIADSQPAVPDIQPSAVRTPKIRSGWTVMNGTPVPGTPTQQSPTLDSAEFVARCKKGGEKPEKSEKKAARRKKRKSLQLEE